MLLAGCGSKHPAAPTTPTTTSSTPDLHAAERKIFGAIFANPLYDQTPWAVIQIGRGATAKAVVFHLTGGVWRVDHTGLVHLSILGPKPGSTQPPVMQVAMSMTSKTPLIQSALWVDGVELHEKGGGLTSTSGTIYGAPDAPLAKGVHVAVGYARNTGSGSAVAWSFKVG